MRVILLHWINAVILAIGISAGLMGAAKILSQLKTADRYITVKGLAEKQVKANLGIWEIDYREVGNNLTDISLHIKQDQQAVITFLQKNGFNADELEIRPTKVNDQLANAYNTPTAEMKINRYIITAGVRVRSAKVDQIQRASQATGDLVQAGIPLTFDTTDYASSLSPNPTYLFTQLDAIRAQMLADATQSARVVAQQFATDAHTQLGGIRRANQGVFQIMGRDADSSNASNNNAAMNEANAIYKKVRLVTTIDYFLQR